MFASSSPPPTSHIRLYTLVYVREAFDQTGCRVWLGRGRPYGMDLCARFRAPVAARGHGPRLFCTRHMSADKYAEVFRAAGLAVLLYDHRGFGDSGGEPRRQINPWIQARGYRDAVSYARSLEGVDGSRVALWGDSFSGGVALAVAVIDGRVAALVVQVPALGREPPPADPDSSLYRAFKETILSGSVEPCEGDILG